MRPPKQEGYITRSVCFQHPTYPVHTPPAVPDHAVPQQSVALRQSLVYICSVCNWWPQLALSLGAGGGGRGINKKNQLRKTKKCPDISRFPKVSGKEYRRGRGHKASHKILCQLTAEKSSSSFFLPPLCFHEQTPKQSTNPHPRPNIQLGVTK